MTIKTTAKQQDELALAVIERFRRAREYRCSHRVHQGLSVQRLMERTSLQHRREYTSEDIELMSEAFGFCPQRYVGVTQQKVDATYYWKQDLVSGSLGAMFTVSATPEPDIDVATRNKIRESVRQELIAKMQQAGVMDPNLLIDENGKMDQRLQDYLAQQAQALKKVEQTRIVSAASSAAKRVQTAMYDVLVQGDFEQAYAAFSLNQILHGRGIMRFPYYKMKPIEYHTKAGGIGLKWDTIRTFKNVDVFGFYPIADADNLQENTGNTELTFITKAQLIDLARIKKSGYDKQAITEIIEDYETGERNWLGPFFAASDFDRIDNTDGAWWGLDEPIALLIHEGKFSGSELADYGIKGIDKLDYVNARIEVVGERTIRCELIESKTGTGRTYYQAPFNKIGDGLYDSIGLGAKLFDTEQRINRLMHLHESNVDWTARPAFLKNRSAFENPNDADFIMPGGQYDVELMGGDRSLPDAVRPVAGPPAIFQMIMTQVAALMQQADNDSGIPAFAYGATSNMGQSSLGEYTQRVSSALRTVKGLANHEDTYFLQPCFKQLYHELLQENPDLREGADINVVIRGMSGLLKVDQRKARQQEVLPLVMQAAQMGAASPQALQFGIRQVLEDAGYPVDELGMSDPVTDNALAVAAGMVQQSGQPATQQAPTLDGRSGPIPQDNYAAPDGMNQANIAQLGPVPTSS